VKICCLPFVAAPLDETRAVFSGSSLRKFANFQLMCVSECGKVFGYTAVARNTNLSQTKNDPCA